MTRIAILSELARDNPRLCPLFAAWAAELEGRDLTWLQQ